MALLLQSTAYTRTFLMVGSADHVTGLAAATVTVSMSKAGGSFGAPSISATATNIANGWYSIAISTTDTNTLGDLAFHCTTASADPTDFTDQVYLAIPANVTQLLGTAWLTPGVAGTPDVNAKLHGGTSQTGADVGSIVGSVKTQTDKLVFTVTNKIDANVYDVDGVALGTHASGMFPADVRDLLGTAWLTPGVAGTPDVNAKLLGATAQTGRDIGSSVLLSSGTGTGQISLSSGTVSLTGGQFTIKKNTTLVGVTFLMTDTTGTPQAGLSVTAQRSIDGGTIGTCVNAVTAVSAGLYKITLDAADLNGTWITFIMTASGAAVNAFTVTTQV